MINVFRPLVVFLLLAACSLPRGAAISNEVLRAQNSDNPQIAVYPVTRALLPRFSSWPYTGKSIRSDGWLRGSGRTGEPRIRPYDRVDLIVWDSEENSLIAPTGAKLVEMKNLRVSQSGHIYVPYLGRQRIAGKTQEAARHQLETQMIDVVPSAQVQLSVLPGTGSAVSLVGGVNAPGTVALPDGGFTVLGLIAQGGGPQATLRNPRVRLVRGGHTYATSLQRLYDDPRLDTTLVGGDKVMLVSDDRYFRALGASGKEQLIYFEKEQISALDAMSLIGGLEDSRANPKGVLILRQYSPRSVRADGVKGPQNTRTVFTIDLTSADGLFSAEKFAIHPQDTVLVTESPVTSARTVFALVGSAVGVSNQISN
ncbi:polysaccharide biosynthesis/export family protein [Oceanicola sp. D3]|uniref:polysaccharide biosynthesis/export family protein n=1 Tax=Oceanicola sp. D3 TaxID=2587163 RepID=UPI00143D6E0D|nr:polysaccharide biosynthesis/export family protein [Oceanicola sp. D3]